MHGSPEEFIGSVSGGLGIFYLLMCLLNWGTALKMWLRQEIRPYCTCLGVPLTNLMTWFAVGTFFFVLAPLSLIGIPPQIPAALRHLVNDVSGPVTLTFGSLAAMAIFFFGRRFFTKPAVGWWMLNLTALAMGMAMTDPNFYLIAAKPDNVPIVGLVFLLGYFTWLATHKAVINDDRIAQGLPPLEKLDDEKVLVWPDLVYTEMICMVALTAFLLVWGIGLQAPLEEPASAVKTPNPSKAPWYFLGLQEMLVYFDPWMAGVVLPSVVIFGLMAIPFLDFNKKGNGYYTIAERKFSYIVFQLGFLELWVVLIILGTFLRGPNWNFFGPFEYWDAHKVLAQNNVNLSEYFWIHWLGTSLPKAPSGSGIGAELLTIVKREAPGIVLTLFYLIAMPPIMAMTVFRKFFVKMGFLRFMLMSNLLLLMVALPLKMMLRWTVNLKYIISIPEYFLNL